MMNKSVFIAAALALAVVGCGDNKQAQDAKAAADKAAQAAKDSACLLYTSDAADE